MKRPITLSADLLRKVSSKMNHDEKDKILKIKILQNTLGKIFNNKRNANYKIRRNPESRLVLHALCLYDTHPECVR